MTKRLYLVRHAQTAWNRDNRIQGHSDLPLSPLGQEQASQVGAFFASRHLRGIFTSHLRRSLQTAQAIASGNGHGVSPAIHQALAEMHLGAWEGLTAEEVDARFDGAYQRWRVRPSAIQIPGAEELPVFRARVRGVLDEILSRTGEGEHVIVSHGGVIVALLADLLRADYDTLLRKLRLDNGGVTALDCGTGAPHVLWINSTQHLEPMADPAPEGWY